VAKKVKVGIITSSPDFIPKAKSAI
jgi:hypothetical protein